MANLSSRNNQIKKIPTPQSPDAAGFIQAFAGSTAPQGWSLCDGSVLEQADYPALYATLGSTWDGFAHPVDGTPTVGGSQFAIPNLKGLYLGGIGDSGSGARSLGVFQDDATAPNGLVNAASSISGSAVSDGVHTHARGNSSRAANNGTTYTVPGEEASTGQLYTGSSGAHTHTLSGTAAAQGITGDSETRPRTAPVNYIIKL